MAHESISTNISIDMSRAPLLPRGGPYPSTTAGLGGVPNVSLDVPICAVFIVIYLFFAVTNVVIHQTNRRRQHKFLLSIFLTGFSMARVATFALRIVWAERQHNIRLAIAANIFVSAGILIVYILNLVLAQRILRAMQPSIGWNPILRVAYKALYASIGAALVMVISSLVISLYTLDLHTRSKCRDIQLTAITYLLIFTCLPLIHILVAILLPTPQDAETFGIANYQNMRTKVLIVTASSLLCLLITGFKAGVNWSPPRPARNPPWYDSKASFYSFTFMLEIFVLAILTFSRIDKRFWIPDGCTGVGDYTRKGKLDEELAIEEGMSANRREKGEERR